MSLEIRKLAPTFGAEISGIDITRPLTPDEEADVIGAIAEHGVCIYRNTGLTDETHVWFSRLFGNLWTVGGQTGRPGSDRYASPFLFDAGNRPVWQIAPEPGATDDMHRNFDATRPATDTFSAISNIDERFYAIRIGGDTFVIDMSPPFIVIFQRAVRPRQVTNSSDRPCQLAMISIPRVTQLSLRPCKHRRRACGPAALAEQQDSR